MIPISLLLECFIAFQKEEECNIITLGIGFDTKAEENLKRKVSKMCKFFGADPIERRNKKLYQKIGKYFKMAVAATSGDKTASVLGCKSINFTVLRVTYLLA